jgi:hypothetical protein
MGEPCSTELPDNSEYTGNFLYFSSPFDPGTSRKPYIDPLCTRLPDRMR